MQEHSVTHADFTVDHSFAAPVSKVYEAFADKQAKEQWFKGPNADEGEHTMDFKVGGSELNSGTFPDGTRHTFKAHYYDIVPDHRIVYAYEMYLGDKRISVSLTTIVLTSEGDNTKLVLHESGAFLDGYDTLESRERGTRDLLQALETAVTK